MKQALLLFSAIATRQDERTDETVGGTKKAFECQE
jgi:hypothetical protein